MFSHYRCETRTGWGQRALHATVIGEAKVHTIATTSEKQQEAARSGSHGSFVPGVGHLRAERMRVLQRGVVMLRFAYFMVQLFIP